MPNDDIILFLSGATTLGCVVLAVCFLRFWARTRERLFAIFAVAFALYAVHYVAVFMASREETEALVYAIRALAFGLILVAIVDKNRRPG
jgi:hypothetical protein